MSTINLKKIIICKKQFLSIPKEERLFFILMSNFLNELHVLAKMQLFSTAETTDDIERKGRNYQSFQFAYLTAGKLLEGWNLICKVYNGKQLSRKYNNQLSAVAKKSYKELKKYFSKDNVIKTLRNSYVFHYPTGKEDLDILDRIITETPDEQEELELYTGKFVSNNLYYFPFVTTIFHSLRGMQAVDINDAINKVLKEITLTNRLFYDFLGEIMGIFFKEHSDKFDTKDVSISGVENANDVVLPYFTSDDGIF